MSWCLSSLYYFHPKFTCSCLFSLWLAELILQYIHCCNTYLWEQTFLLAGTGKTSIFLFLQCQEINKGGLTINLVQSDSTFILFLWMRKAVSYPSDRARVSAASVEQYTILNLLDFKTATVHFFCFCHRWRLGTLLGYCHQAGCWSLRQSVSINEFYKRGGFHKRIGLEWWYFDMTWECSWKYDDIIHGYCISDSCSFNFCTYLKGTKTV